MIDYFLPSGASTVRLEILDAQQNLVRRFSSQGTSPVRRALLPVAERWFPQPKVLEKTAGMHRFVWDLAWHGSAAPDADEDAESHSLSGPKAVPGDYRVQLTVDGKTQTQSLKVVMDPRSPATAEVLARQLQLGQQIFAESIEPRRALAEIVSVQKQLADIQQQLKQNTVGAQNPTLKAAIEEAQSGIARILANHERVTEGSGLQDAYTALASALRVVENGDRTAPSQAIALYKESSPQLKSSVAEWIEFKHTRLAQLNQQLREADISPITIAEIEQEVEFLLSR
jgi:hypothetical protein